MAEKTQTKKAKLAQAAEKAQLKVVGDARNAEGAQPKDEEDAQIAATPRLRAAQLTIAQAMKHKMAKRPDVM